MREALVVTGFFVFNTSLNPKSVKKPVNCGYFPPVFRQTATKIIPRAFIFYLPNQPIPCYTLNRCQTKVSS